MSAHCCHNATPFDGQSPAYRRALVAVIAINVTLFCTEAAAGALAGSQALMADALDFAADSATYSLSLAMIGRPLAWRAGAALAKGVSLALMGLFVLGSTLVQLFVLGVPNEAVMGVVGTLALAANVACALILLQFRNGDANVRSVWLCSRNDAIGNGAVIGAAGAVAWSQTAWPDLIVAGGMAALFLSSAFSVIRQAKGELARDGVVPSPLSSGASNSARGR